MTAKKTLKDTEAQETEAIDNEAVAETKAEVEPKVTAKAGKRSAKAVKEAEVEETRKAKASDKTETAKPKAQPSKPRVLHGKKYREVSKLIDRNKHYELAEAIELAKKTSTTKFDSSVELHVNLGVDPRQADQMVRASVVLPAGTGKSLRVAVICPADQTGAAKGAGADVVGEDDLMARIEKGQIEFDVLIATPQVMPKLGKLAKVLGPKGLMPNPKSGTVTANVAEAVKAAKGGRVEFRIDKQAIVHQAIGKVSFNAKDLESNVLAFTTALMATKPAAAKGTYVLKMAMTTSMGPSLKLNHTSLIAAANQAK